MTTKNMPQRSQRASALSGFLASVSTTIFFPLEMAKVQMMVSDKFSANFIPQYRNAVHAIRSLYESKGFLALYRGWHISIFSGLAWSIYFANYERAKRRYSESFKETYKETYRFAVAAEAAVLSRILTNPMWVVKTRVMLQNHSDKWYGETVEAIRKIWKLDGVKGFFSGMVPGLILCWNGAFQLYFYELFKELLDSANSSLKTGLAGGASKLTATTLLYPMQTLMVRLQQEQYSDYIFKKSTDVSVRTGKPIFNGFLHCINESFKHGGIKTFYRGFSLHLIRLIPSNALFFIVYEKALKFFN